MLHSKIKMHPFPWLPHKCSPKPLFNYTQCALQQSPFLQYAYPQVHVMFSEIITHDEDFWKNMWDMSLKLWGKNYQMFSQTYSVQLKDLICNKIFKESNTCPETLCCYKQSKYILLQHVFLHCDILSVLLHFYIPRSIHFWPIFQSSCKNPHLNIIYVYKSKSLKLQL